MSVFLGLLFLVLASLPARRNVAISFITGCATAGVAATTTTREIVTGTGDIAASGAGLAREPAR